MGKISYEATKNNKTLTCSNCQILEEENKMLKEKLRNIDVEGWKGSDKLIFEQINQVWKVTEHRKDKESGMVSLNTHIIPELNVASVWECILNRCKTIGEKTKSREIAIDLITSKNIAVGLDEFWGGKNRSKYLFPLLYYPLKILENKGFIKYGGRGNIIRLK